MSYFQLNDGGTPGVPGIETLTGNSGGAVSGDASFNVNILGSGDVTVTGNPGTNTLTISNTLNLINGTGTTVGLTTADIFTFAMGATPRTYKFTINVAAYETTTPAGLGYFINASVRTNGSTATVILEPDADEDEDVVLQTDADWEVVVSTNNVILRVTGVTGLTLTWVAQATYIRTG